MLVQYWNLSVDIENDQALPDSAQVQVALCAADTDLNSYSCKLFAFEQTQVTLKAWTQPDSQTPIEVSLTQEKRNLQR